MNITELVKKCNKWVKTHDSEIMLGIGISGMITSTILAVKATPRALDSIEYTKETLGVDDLTKVEIFKSTWKCYVPSTIIATASIACLIGSSRSYSKKNIALATAYSISENTLRTYQEKVIESIGEKKERVIRDEVNREKLNNSIYKDVVLTEKGNDLCYDAMSDRYFRGNIDTIKRAEEEINRLLRVNDTATLNEFYYEIGLDSTSLGDMLGWDINDGYMALTYSSLLTKDDKPCFVFDGRVKPI